MNDMNEEQIRASIVPKSDQWNYDDLISGPVTVTVAAVIAGSKEQPVNVKLVGHDRVYRPSKTMRRMMVIAWGPNGHDWVGRSMTLYGDPNVKFGGVAVGGIKISHMSHINEAIAANLTASKGKKAPHKVLPLEVSPGGSGGRKRDGRPDDGAPAKPETDPPLDAAKETSKAFHDAAEKAARENPPQFDNSNLTEAQKGVVKVAKFGWKNFADVWQAYEHDQKMELGGKAFFDFVKDIAKRSDLGEKFDAAGNALTTNDAG